MTLTLEQRRTRDVLRQQIKAIEADDRAAKKVKARERKREQRQAVKESAAPNKRQPRQQDPLYLAYVRRQPCMLAEIDGGCEGHTDAAHLRFANLKVGRSNPGMGTKSDDRWTLPLCRKHHTEQHATGREQQWWLGKGIDPDAACQELRAKYEAQR